VKQKVFGDDLTLSLSIIIIISLDLIDRWIDYIFGYIMCVASEDRLQEKWRLLRYLHSLRQHTSHRGSCIENVLWEIGTGPRATIGPDLFVTSAVSRIKFYLADLEESIGERIGQWSRVYAPAKSLRAPYAAISLLQG